MVQKIYYAKTQMNNGLVSPIIEGRPDFAATDKSCRQELNIISTVYGSAKNRGGTVFVGNNKKADERFVLMPFVVGERVAYVLEFGNKYIRVYRYHDQVKLDNAIYEIETQYDLKDFFDEDGRCYFDYKQSADVLYIVHEKYAPVKLSRYGDTNWALTDVKFNNGPWDSMNTDKSQVIQVVGDSTGIVSLKPVAGKNPVADIGVISSGSSGNTYGVNIKFFIDGHNGAGTLLAEKTWYAPVPALYWAQLAAEVINSLPQFVATNPTNNTLVITATSNQSEYTNKQCSVYVSVDHGVGYVSYKYNNGVFSDGSEPGTMRFSESWVGRKVRLTQINTLVEGWRSNWQVTTDTLCRAGSNYYKASSGGTTGGQMPTHVEETESDGGVAWEYIHSGYGTVQITEFVSETEVKAKVLDYIPKGIIDVGTWQWEFSLFDYVTNTWPCSVEFFKDRLSFGVNLATGPAVVFSVSGDYENFADMDHGEQLPESAMTLKLFTNLNKITWLCTQKNLYVGTEGSIVMVYPITGNDVFGPNNITYEEVSSVGTCKVRPIKIDGDILFLGPKGTAMYVVQYNFDTDSYRPVEVSILASKHLEFGIVDWALQYEPNRMVYAVRRDGKVLGLVYNREQEVRAFNLLDTDGAFETICAIPNSTDAIDEVWVGVRRNINGVDKRYVEYFSLGMPNRVPVEYSGEISETLKYLLDKSLYIDCAKVFTFEAPTTNVTGLEHLEGKKVSVIADNIDYQLTVNNGAITLPKGASNVKVGLPYMCILEPMPINLDSDNGTGIARVQRINSIVARIYRTHSFKFGPSLDDLYEAHVHNTTHDIPGKLMSGDIKLDWPSDTTDQNVSNTDIVNSSGARMIFVQDRPFPVHWSAFSVAVGVSESIR